MSSQGHHNMTNTTPPKRRTGEINLTARFSEQMSQLCLNQDYSDVIFIVDLERLPAHRVILAARSDYFRAMLYGGLAETTQREIELDAPVAAFKALLRYIYSGNMLLSNMCEEVIIDLLGLANQYGMVDLETAISQYLRLYLTLENVCAILDAARLYSLPNLTQVCMNFMDAHAKDILLHESFKSLSKESLQEVLKRDSFFASEQDIFHSVCEWCMHNEVTDSVLNLVRLPLIDLNYLLQVVRPTGILSADKLLDAILEQTNANNLPYRSASRPEENVAKPKFMAQCIAGECRAALLDGDIVSYDMEKGYTRHTITDNNDHSIIVELGSICLLNHIKILLWDRDSRAYSYYVEVSVTSTKWERIIDYTEYNCRSWQFLYFPARPVRYIRLVGTHNTVNKIFHVVSLEAMYTADFPKLYKDLEIPTKNVAIVEMGALVVNGVSRTRNALLNGDYVNYDWDSGYTCHQLGSGDILVRLGQPYYIGSMRLLLWDCDDRTYSYYIETSVDEKNWQTVVDKRSEQVQSWQNITFSPRPVVYIRIVGTANTANEIFHVVHFECPSQSLAQATAADKKRNSSSSVVPALPAPPTCVKEEEEDW